MFNQQSSIPQLRDTAGIVLCGGSSIRMGMPKAWLPCGTDTFLQQIVGRLSEVLSPVIVVSSPDQSLPPLDSGVVLAHDRNPGRGPLEGLAAGLQSLPEAIETAVVETAVFMAVLTAIGIGQNSTSKAGLELLGQDPQH